jgi:Xaa-Pro dipeptidase
MPKYTLFDSDTYNHRLVLARKVLGQHGLEAAVMVAPEHQFYFAGFDSWTGVNSPQALILTINDDEPTLLLRNVDLSLATESTWLTDVRTYQLHSENFPDIVRDILKEKGVLDGGIGIEMQSYALNFGLGRDLVSALAPAELVDSTELLGQLRLVKSDQEISLISKAGEFANQGLQSMTKSLESGSTEIAVAGSIEHAMRQAGSDYWSIPVELTSGDRSAGCHGTPRPRIIQRGDLVHAEFAGVCERYHATAIQTVCYGNAAKRQSEIYDIALQSLDAGIAAIMPGVNVATVEEASLEPLIKQGLEHAAMMRFGYGIGAAYPPIWLETLQISRDFDTVLQSGMVFVLHSCIELPDENLGVIQGGTYVLEETGIRMLAGAGSVGLISI